MRRNRGSLLLFGDGGRRVEVGGEALVLACWMVAPRSADTHGSRIQNTSKMNLKLFYNVIQIEIIIHSFYPIDIKSYIHNFIQPILNHLFKKVCYISSSTYKIIIYVI